MSVYEQMLLSVEPNDLVGYWTLGDPAGTTIEDRSAYGHEGVAHGVTLEQSGIGDGTTSAQCDGQDDYIDLYSSGLQNAFSGTHGTLLIWVKVADAGVWADGQWRKAVSIRVDNNNRIEIRKVDTANTLQWLYVAGGTSSARGKTVTATGWMSLAITWDTTANEVRAYYNGVQEGATLTGLGTWTGSIGTALLGAYDPQGLFQGWNGVLAHAALWKKALSADQVSTLAKLYIAPWSLVSAAETARPLIRGIGPTTWTIAIDWDRDGKFTETYDDVTNRVVSAEWFLGARQPYQDTADNSVLALTLTNQDRRYSPEYNSGPLSGKLVPFRPVRIQSSDGLITRTHWQGWVEGFQPFTNPFGQRYVQIVATGPMQLLKSAETSLPLQENKHTDEIIADLVEEVVFPPCLASAWVVGRVGNSELGVTTFLPAPYTVLDEGILTVPMAGDNWVRQGGSSDAKQSTFNVYHAIRDVAAAERGRFFYDRDGKAIFWNRHRMFQGEVAAALFDDAMTDMAYTYAGLEHLKNDIIVTCHPRDISTSDQDVLWELKGAVINVSTAEPRVLYVNYKDENDKRVGAKAVTVGDLKFQKGTATAVVEAQANGAKLTFTNTGTTEAVITECIVRGRKIVDSGNMDAKEIDSDSITEYGRRTLQLNLPLIDQLNLAQYIAKLEKTRLGQPRGAISSLKLVSHGTQGGSQHPFQRGLSLGDKVIVAETQTDHEGEHYIVGESHKLTAGGTLFETTWYLEPAPASSPWKLGVEGRSELSASTVLLAC